MSLAEWERALADPDLDPELHNEHVEVTVDEGRMWLTISVSYELLIAAHPIPLAVSLARSLLHKGRQVAELQGGAQQSVD